MPPQQKEGFVLPGTTLMLDSALDADFAKQLLEGFFTAGGLVLSQVSSLTGMEPHSVQNWVKRGFCSPPVCKKYGISQFCRLVILHLLKDSLALPEITGLLSYINGDLTDESDDLLSDDRLYLCFLRTLQVGGLTRSYNREKAEKAAETVCAAFREPFPGGKLRLQRTLVTMVCAYHASLLHREAAAMVKTASAERA